MWARAGNVIDFWQEWGRRVWGLPRARAWHIKNGFSPRVIAYGSASAGSG